MTQTRIPVFVFTNQRARLDVVVRCRQLVKLVALALLLLLGDYISSLGPEGSFPLAP